MSPRHTERHKGHQNWTADPMARLLFLAGPPPRARSGEQPPIPFESLDEMRDAWLAVRDELLPQLVKGDQLPWAERQWGDRARGE